MKARKIWLLICSIALVAIMGITAIAVFADTEAVAGTNDETIQSAPEDEKAATEDDNTSKKPLDKIRRRIKPELTDEQIKAKKEEMKAKRDKIKAKIEAQREKWNALTDKQKSEIYDLQDQIDELRKKMADKYEEFGIIDQETAEKIKNRITDSNTKIRESGVMPGLGRKGCKRWKVQKD